MKINYQTKKILGCYLLALLFCLKAHSQTIQLNGKVVDSVGLAVPGASVKIKGTTQGKVTSVDGSFSLNYDKAATLTVSAIGYVTQDVAVTGKNTIQIILRTDTKILSEVVVTALGIKRDKRLLTYATQEVKAADIERAKEPNVLNALTGKVAGMQITSSSGVPGSAASVIIRGSTSVLGNNQALIVLDGVPIDNQETGNISSGSGSNRLVDIDPLTIESINVLKGAAATTLYGSAGARGVLLITTKNGSLNKKPVITFSSDFSFDTALLPQRQTKYAQGTNGIYYNGDNQKISTSYGPLLDTLKINGVAATKYDPYKTFFKTGHTVNNSLSIGGGNDKNSYFLSYSNLDQQGTTPNSDFKRNSLFTKFTSNIYKSLNATFQLGYTNSAQNRLPEGASNGPLFTLFSEPVSWNPYPYVNADGSQRLYRYSRNNPLWAAANESNHYVVNRFTPIITLNFTPASWLTITERAGADIYSEQDKYWENPSAAIQTLGRIIDQNANFRQFNHDLIISAAKEFGKFNVNFLVGNNLVSTYNQYYTETGNGLSINNYYNIGAASTITASESNYLQRKIGFYAQGNVEYNRLLSLTLTGRYDGSSVLSSQKSFYPYGSASGGFIFSELFSPELSKIISYGKVRVSYATVGNDNVGAYVLNTPYNLANINGIQFPFQGQSGFLISNTLGNTYLQNERLNEAETGLELKFLKKRLGFDFSYYNRKTTNGLIPGVAIAPSTGYTGTTVNSAQLSNKGVELLIEGSPVRTKDFSWDINLNYTRNRSKVLALYPGTDQLGRIIVGQPFNVFYGTKFTRTASGALLIDDKGLPMEDANQGVVGDPNPKWLAGLSNTFRYKQFSFSFFFDMKKGGDIQNDVDSYGYYYGTSKGTEDRSAKVVQGISATTSKENTVSVNAQTYYQYIGTIYENFIQDGTYIKLRNVNFSYQLNDAWLKKTPLKSLSIGATGRNLWIYSPHFTGADPEVSSYGLSTGAVGIYSFSTPTSRSISINLKAIF